GGTPTPARDPFPPINPPDSKKKPQGEEVPAPKERKKTLEQEEVRATVKIDVPEGGKLFVDGRHIETAAGTRRFQTPPLKPGKTYYYDIRIDIDRNGALASDERRVVVRPGEEVVVAFPRLGQPPALTAQRPR